MSRRRGESIIRAAAQKTLAITGSTIYNNFHGNNLGGYQ
jgi:hypothetical protein